MSTVLPIAVFVAALVLTYLFCIRPMRRGECGVSDRSNDRDASQQRDEEVRKLRQEVEELRRTRDQAHRNSG